MDLTSIELSKALLQLLRDLPEDQLEGFVDSLRLKVAEAANGSTASLAPDDGGIGVMVLHGEDGSTTVLTLEVEPD